MTHQPADSAAGLEARTLIERADTVSASAMADLFRLQREDGHWVFELESDATIPADYIFLEHFLDEIDDATEKKLAQYLRDTQGSDGGWPLFRLGEADLSATIKAYYALKLTGDREDAPHMTRAREFVLGHGGAARANVFTRFALALFGQVPWRAVPTMPVEATLLPRWFPFHLYKVSYWSRTVIAPMLIVQALKPTARNPRQIGVAELFRVPPEQERRYQINPTGSWIGNLFLGLDPILRWLEPKSPKRLRARAIQAALDFIMPRLNGEDGLGAIYPAMAYAVMAFDCLGYSKDYPPRATAMRSIKKLLVLKDGSGYCQPCVSPVWDTALSAHALLEAGESGQSPRLQKAWDWLLERQVRDVAGDWREGRPDLKPGGWAFQYRNDHYPDLDDTAVVTMALERANRGRDDPRMRDAIQRATEWVIGMQSSDGGWAAFDANNTYYYLNHIPFSDHGALLDPPTADVTARCVGMLSQVGLPKDHPAIAKGIEWLKKEQESDGSWFGRWGMNYIYGTWSVLTALNGAGEDLQAPYIRKAVDWLKSRQQPDGGWGEDGRSYYPGQKDFVQGSTPSQTAWAVLALMSAGEVESEAAARGVEYLLAQPREGARWREELYNAVGFPKVFYLRYHGYSAFFPLWAVARYRNLMSGNERRVETAL
jgi:squalene-hopene/tetraprenyl-beta-curcumene cyclase